MVCPGLLGADLGGLGLVTPVVTLVTVSVKLLQILLFCLASFSLDGHFSLSGSDGCVISFAILSENAVSDVLFFF